MARLPVGLLLVIKKNPSVWPRRPSVWLRIIPRTGKFWKMLRGGDKTAAIHEYRKLLEESSHLPGQQAEEFSQQARNNLWALGQGN